MKTDKGTDNKGGLASLVTEVVQAAVVTVIQEVQAVKGKKE
ncbi:MAG: hypothetical protein AAB430_02800 [Patescibacteria group bacterium]